MAQASSSGDDESWRPWYESHSDSSEEGRPPSWAQEEGIPLRSLGVIKEKNIDGWQHFEWKLRYLCLTALTTHWPCIQGGTCPRTLDILMNVFKGLELNKYAVQDLMLLAASGIPGRTEFNYLMWCLLNTDCHHEPYVDLSEDVSKRIMRARKSFDRPPRGAHKDCQAWGWLRMKVPSYPHWSPLAVPTACLNGERGVLTGHRGKPLPPPFCWPKDIVVEQHRVDMHGPENLDLTKNPHYTPPTQAREPQDAAASSADGFQWTTK